jgi:hypothetical protein
VGLGAWRRLPIADRIANETFITKADVDWFSEQLLFSLLGGKGAFPDPLPRSPSSIEREFTVAYDVNRKTTELSTYL